MDADSPSSFAAKAARRHTIAPASPGEVLSAVSGVRNNSMLPPPLGNIASPASVDSSTDTPSSSSSSSPDFPSDSSSRPSPEDAAARQQKRLSLNFPIQAASGGGTRSRPQSWYGTPVPSPEIPPTPTAGSFLTALAAQERRVLELKEELQKAEFDLVQLKRQWSTHEASKKRSDTRNVLPLQPLNTSMANLVSLEDDAEQASLSVQREMERRKALLTGMKTSQRKVFSGSRHTRQLSLLSPERNFVPSFPQPSDAMRQADTPCKSETTASPATTNHTNEINDINTNKDDAMGLQTDALLRAGKQIANDFKDGLLTFIEDIRQATVGEEALNPPDQERQRQIGGQGGKSNIRGAKGSRTARPHSVSFMWDSKSGDNSALIDIGGSFWKEHGVEEQGSAQRTKPSRPAKKVTKTPSKTPVKQVRRAVDDFGESWDTWDTPKTDKDDARSSSADSASEGRTSPVSGRSSTRTSTSSADLPPSLENGSSTPNHNSKRDSLPWPSLDKLSPTNLKRTATHLMKEWEKSLAAAPSADAMEEEPFKGP